MNPDLQPPATAPMLNSANVVAGMIRFLHAVRVRRGTLLATLLISAVLGTAYYTTATRMYDAHAQVRIVQTERDHNSLTSAQQSSQANSDVFQMMATYQRIMSGDRVLTAALEDLPKEYCVDFEGYSPDVWPTILKNNVTVTNERGESYILDLATRRVSQRK